MDTALARNAPGVVEINNGTAGQYGALVAGVRDAGTTNIVNPETQYHQSTGTPAAGFGTGTYFKLDANGGAGLEAGRLAVAWSNATFASATAYMDFLLNLNNAGSSSKMRLFGSGGLSVNNTTDPGAGIVSAGGYRTSAVAVASLPASPVLGQIATVNDGTASLAWGATVTGGGSTKYLVWYNGTNWTVVGK